MVLGLRRRCLRRSCVRTLSETKMAAKRRRDEVVDSPPKLADSTDDDATESPAGFAKPVYLVAKRCDESPYSLLVADADAVAVGHEALPGARNLGGIPGTKRGMSFVAAHSKHGSWIVGVGGRMGDTIIYDPIARKEFMGPELRCPKHEPILISLGGKLYAISRRPKVRIRAKRDFEPWFESLNFNKGIPCIDHLGCPNWRELPPPPFFPCLLTPEEFRNPPEVSVSSYATVGAYILISLEQEDKGTYGFHVVKKTWEKVCDKSLPFVGQAVPLGGSLFAACSVKPKNAAAAACVFLMSIKASTGEVSSKLTTSVLSIHEFPVASDEEIPRPIFCPLRKGSFCSIIMAAHQNQECNYMMDLQIFLTAFQMDNVEATLTAEDSKVPVQLKQHNRTYEFNVQPRYVVSYMPVVAALSMDNEYFQLFKEKKTQAREITPCNIFEAPVIRSMSRVISNLDQSTIVRLYGDNRL